MENAMDEQRPDGFTLVRTLGSPGLDIHVPARQLPADEADLVERLTDRRRSQDGFDGADRRRGAWFAWAPDVAAAEEKIARELRERLHH
jgi:hypothetical protein